MSKKTKEIKELKESLYTETASTPIFRLWKSEECKRSAKILLIQHQKDTSSYKVGSKIPPQVDFVAQMLLGFALENLLIYKLLEKGENIFGEPSTFLKKKYTRHKLQEWIKGLNLTLTTEQRDLIQRLEYFSKWAGRYPIPSKNNKYVLAVVSSKDEEIFEKLYNQISEL